ncbi:MAG: exodeoxyribonuclease III [Candidatus Shapirobacteria bacterium]|jgi:exodeoxyribonuclease-3
MGIRIVSWNVAGIRAAIKKGLWGFVEKDQADIYCFQETKAFPHQVPMIECPKGYIPFWNSAEKAGYSGVMILTKIEPKKVIVGDQDSDWDNEGRVIITKFDEFTLINGYFPNGKKDESRLSYKMKFYDHFLKYINEQRERGEKIIFVGDVNTAHEAIDLARPEENENVSGFLEMERDWIDLLIKNSWVDTYRLINGNKIQYSWWSQRGGARKRNVGWRIDYIFVDSSLSDLVRQAFILPEVEGSDHCPVGIEIEL